MARRGSFHRLRGTNSKTRSFISHLETSKNAKAIKKAEMAKVSNATINHSSTLESQIKTHYPIPSPANHHPLFVLLILLFIA